MGQTPEDHDSPLARDLDDAISTERLDLHYQPFFALAGRRLRGFEALARWVHPELGDVPSSVFVPIAEQSGQIERLGLWAVEKACRAALSWAEPVTVAVNVSPAQLRREGFASRIGAVLSTTGLEPGRLELEVTENVLIDDIEDIIVKLLELRRIGVRVALDDFGTGFSSLSYLRRLPVDKVKIDQSFVQTVTNDKVSEAIIAAIVTIGRLLNVTITAEGVETEPQLDILRLTGCDEVQGYLFGGPSPTTDRFFDRRNSVA